MSEKSKPFREWHCTGHNCIIGKGNVVIDRDYATLFPNNRFKFMF